MEALPDGLYGRRAVGPIAGGLRPPYSDRMLFNPTARPTCRRVRRFPSPDVSFGVGLRGAGV